MRTRGRGEISIPLASESVGPLEYGAASENRCYDEALAAMQAATVMSQESVIIIDNKSEIRAFGRLLGRRTPLCMHLHAAVMFVAIMSTPRKQDRRWHAHWNEGNDFPFQIGLKK